MVVAALAPSTPAAPATLGFNAGGARSVAASDGIEYRAEQRWRPGAQGVYLGGDADADIDIKFFVDGDEADRPLYGVFREGTHLWRFAAQPGLHELTLRFNETEADGPGIRRMLVAVDQDTLLADLDIFALVGKERALNVRRAVLATSDSIEIIFAPHRESLLPPRVSAIALRPLLSGTPPPLAAPTELRVRRGDDHALFTWRPACPMGLDRYEVWAQQNRGALVASSIRYLPWIRLPADPQLRYLVRALDAGGRLGAVADAAGAAPRSPGPLARWELVVGEDDLRAMERALPEKIRRPAMLSIDGVSCSGRLQFRGTGSLRQPKKSWKLRIDEGPLVRGSSVVSMASNFNDIALMREPLSHRLMVDCDLPTYLVDPVSLSLNGDFAGVYSHVEDPDQDYLERIGFDVTDRCYKVEAGLFPLADEAAYLRGFENTQTDDWQRRDVIELVQELDRLEDPELETWLRATFDVDAVIDWYALQVFLGNDDFAMHNFILHRGRLGGPWRVLPWDVDVVLHEHGLPANFTTSAAPDSRDQHNALAERLLEPPSLLRRYLRRLEILLDGPLATERTMATLDSVAELIVEDAFLDTEKLVRESEEMYRQWSWEMARVLAGREATLRTSIAELMPEPWVDLTLNEIVRSDSTVVELHYRGVDPLDLEGLHLTDDPIDPERWPVPPQTITEGQRTTVTLPEHLTGWLALVAPNGGGIIDSVDLATFPELATIGRFPEGAGRMRVLPEATPDAPNLWDSPLLLELSVDDSYPTPGTSIELLATVRSTWRPRIAPTLYLEAIGPGGVWLPVPFAVERELQELTPGQEVEERFEIALPANAPWLTGGRYDLTLRAFEGDDPIAAESIALYVDTGPPATLLLNELCASNSTLIADEFGEFDDWVEIVNACGTTRSTAGLYLSDDLEDDPLRWALPARSLAPGEVLLLWLDDDPEQGELHAPFKLAREGEELALVRDPDAEPVDWIVFGYQESDWSLARTPAGQPTWEASSEPTPGNLR